MVAHQLILGLSDFPSILHGSLWHEFGPRCKYMVLEWSRLYYSRVRSWLALVIHSSCSRKNNMRRDLESVVTSIFSSDKNGSMPSVRCMPIYMSLSVCSSSDVIFLLNTRRSFFAVIYRYILEVIRDYTFAGLGVPKISQSHWHLL